MFFSLAVHVEPCKKIHQFFQELFGG
ncbi:Protein of unknown function [Bacillus wiedmannii]|uniref:Uncharacterized protein n=1 Tax=Bacillus wiedmannii TaxID=1890302 RepID=A0AB37Z1M8_9BACI|nr:Protein of unknown function [Bacillus wiedmannii]